MTTLELVVIAAGVGLVLSWYHAVPPGIGPVLPPKTLPGIEPGPKASSYPGAAGEVDQRAWVQIPAGPVWSIRTPSRSWVTASTFDALVSAFLRYAELDATPIRVLDASLPTGGPMPPHKSHQEGRDIDLKFTGASPMPVRPLTMLLRALIVDARLQAVFLGWSVQRLVWELLKADPGLEPTGQLLAELQYPLAPGTGQTRIRDWPGHTKHLHVRYRS